MRVAWSPTDEYLLVVNTYVDTAETRADDTMLILRPNGEVVDILAGTHGVWIDETHLVYQRYVNDGRWWLRDVATGLEDQLTVPIPVATNIAVSPDGARIALESFDRNETLVLAIEDASTQLVPGAAPVWYDPHTLLTAEMASCVQVLGDECPDRNLYWTGRFELIDLDRPGDPVRFLDDLPGIGRVAADRPELLVIRTADLS